MLQSPGRQWQWKVSSFELTSLGRGKVRLLHLHKARIDSPSMNLKTNMTLTKSVHKLWIYLDSEQMYRRNWYLTSTHAYMWLLSFFLGPPLKFSPPGCTLYQEGCPPQSLFSILIHFFCLSAAICVSLRSHAHFHVWLVRMFVTDCFCFLWGTTNLIWVTFLKVFDSVILNEWEWLIQELPCEVLFVLRTPEATEMMRKLCLLEN